MSKKITVISILFLIISVFLMGARKEQQELYLKAVAEKDLTQRISLLKEYVQKYGEKKDKFLKFIYLNLSDTSFKLNSYEDTIQFGEKTLGFEGIDDANKLRLFLSLANSYYVTKKDMDKAYQYAESMIELCNKLVDQTLKSDQDQEKKDQFVNNYNNFYIAPSYRLQANILYFKDKDNADNIKLAADKAVRAYEVDKAEQSAKKAFSLALNLFKKNRVEDAISIAEQIIDKNKAGFQEANFLATLYYKKKNRDKAIFYFELAYKAKRKIDLAMKIGQLVYKKDIVKGIRYFADAFVMSKQNKESDAYKYLEQLYFNKFAKDKTVEEKEKGFNTILNAAKARFGISVAVAEEPESSESPESDELPETN